MKSRVYYLLPIILACIPITTVFLSVKVVPYVILILFIVSLLEKEKMKTFKENRNLYYPYIIYVSVFIIYTLISINIKVSSKILERQISMLIIPLIIFYSDLSIIRIRIFLKWFLLVMLAITIFSVVKLLIFMDEFDEWIHIMNEISKNKTYLQFKYPHLMNVHPTYWSYLLILSNILLLNNLKANIIFNRPSIIILLIIFNLNILFLSARTPLIINFLIHFFYILLYLKNERISTIRKILLFLGTSIILITAVINFPFLQFKFSTIASDERVFLWSSALERIQNNLFVLGEGLGQGSIGSRDYILFNDDQRIHYKGYDLHNQYLTNYLDMGVLGIASLLYLLLHPIFKLRSLLNFENFMLLAFVLFISLSLFTETSLYLIKGIVIFSLFSSLLILNNKPNLKI